MAESKKQFCPKGHDTFLCGRYQRQCNDCRNKHVEIDKRIKKFCKHGHDISVVGRNTVGKCNGCLKEKHPLRVGCQPTKICPKGHDKDITGKTKTGRCLVCQMEYAKEWNEKNKEYIKIYTKKYSLKHHKEKQEWQKNKLLIDINYRLRIRLRDRMIKAIKKSWKAGSAVRDVGCNIEFLKQYIQSKFLNGMTWDNWGKVWQLDHITPLWKFDLTDRNEFLKVAHYTNLQPLTIEDHKKKTAKEALERENLFLDKTK